MDITQDDESHHEASSPAPKYSVPTHQLVAIEHPFIIKNVGKGVESLGGWRKMQELTQNLDRSSANLYIHPGDRMSKPLKSANVSSSNILLKVTVPKRVRTQRRRRSPVHDRESRTNEAQRLLRSLRARHKESRIQMIGPIEHTHRFRGMSDFVVSTVNMPFMQKMQEHILPFDYEKLKGFTFDMSKGVKPNAEIIPPPQMTHFRHPFNYSYHQNPSVKPVADQFGNITMSNVHGSVKVFGQPVPPDIHEVPSAPAHELLPFESLEASLKGLIASARRLLEDRPIFTRKALLNSIPDIDSDSTSTNFVKRMYQYCGYSFSSGPWRDAIVRFGVDPRKDPGCRIYQTMMFMLENEPKDSRAKYNRRPADHAAAQEGPRKESHLFDGKTVSKNGKTWQVCDISDPFLSRLLATTDLRQECDIENDGWYQNGTWAKAKIIMKAKIQAILSNEPQDEAVYITVANRLPDVIRPKDTPYTKQYENATGYEVQLASHIRRASAPERILAQNGDNDGDDDKEESDSVASSPTSQDRAIDPRLTAMASSTLGEGIAPPEEVSDGMDIDTPLNESIPTPYEMAL